MKYKAITTELIQRMKDLGIIDRVYEDRLSHNFANAESSFPNNHYLIWEVLSASNVHFGGDAECGRVPADYDNLISRLISDLYPEIENFGVKMEYEKKEDESLKIQVAMTIGNEEFEMMPKDYGDYYDIDSVVIFIKRFIPKKDPALKLYNVSTNDQGFFLVRLDLNKIGRLYKYFGLEWKDEFIDQIEAYEWIIYNPEGKEDIIIRNDMSIKDFHRILDRSAELTGSQVIEICEIVEKKDEEGGHQLLEEIFLSRFENASKKASKILLSKYDYRGSTLLQLVYDNLENHNRLESLNTYISFLYLLNIEFLPKVSKFLHLLKLVEPHNRIFLKDFEWSILLNGYSDKGLFNKVLPILDKSKNSNVMKVCCSTLSAYCYLEKDIFMFLKRRKVFNLFSKILREDYRQGLFGSMYFFFSLYANELKFEKIYSVFQDVYPRLEMMDTKNFMRIINRHLFLNKYNSCIEKDYLNIFEKHSYYREYVLVGLRQSKDEKIRIMLEDAKKTGKYDESFQYDRNTALAEYEELWTAIDSMKNIRRDKR